MDLFSVQFNSSLYFKGGIPIEIETFQSNLVHHCLFTDDKQLYYATTIADIDIRHNLCVSCSWLVRLAIDYYSWMLKRMNYCVVWKCIHPPQDVGSVMRDLAELTMKQRDNRARSIAVSHSSTDLRHIRRVAWSHEGASQQLFSVDKTTVMLLWLVCDLFKRVPDATAGLVIDTRSRDHIPPVLATSQPAQVQAVLNNSSHSYTAVSGLYAWSRDINRNQRYERRTSFNQ